MTEYIISDEQIREIYATGWIDGSWDNVDREDDGIDRSMLAGIVRCRDCSNAYVSDDGYYIAPDGEILLDGTAFCMTHHMFVSLSDFCSLG